LIGGLQFTEGFNQPPLHIVQILLVHVLALLELSLERCNLGMQMPRLGPAIYLHGELWSSEA
jgi:hypothetical protein